MVDRSRHQTNGTGRSISLLKSPAYGDPADPGPLPYRIDLLRDCGFDLLWTDRHLKGPWSTLARWSERWSVPWVQAWLLRRVRGHAAATLVMFESEGHGLALWRRITGRRHLPLVVISCWLADLAAAGGLRRSVYRWLYRAVDIVVVFSANQRETLVAELSIPWDRISVVRLGVDLDELSALSTEDTGTVVAAGRDLGRDWVTLFDAAEGTGWDVRLITRARQVEGLELPVEVTFEGTLERNEYLAHLADAAVVVLPSEIREYPTGQTVLLEAMALGKACVVTDTPAMRYYVDDGVTGVLVPRSDPDALRAAVNALLEDSDGRRAIGASARRVSDQSGGAAAMWAEIGDAIEELIGPGSGEEGTDRYSGAGGNGESPRGRGR